MYNRGEVVVDGEALFVSNRGRVSEILQRLGLPTTAPCSVPCSVRSPIVHIAS